MVWYDIIKLLKININENKQNKLFKTEEMD